MVRINKKNKAPVPAVLLTAGISETEKIRLEYDNGIRDFSFDKEIYGHKEVKSALIRLQDKKCCYCERKIHPGFHGDIEHYRPKAGWIQHDEKINQPGYYWLAYDWDNLFFSCQHCNQKYKKNYFPILNEERRAIDHHKDVNSEAPVFIHPANENPEDYIEFDFEVPKAINNNIRGRITIEKLGLNNQDLNEARLEKLKHVKEDYDVYYIAKNIQEKNFEVKQVFNRIEKKVTNHYEAAQKDETEYASMLRCFFKKYPIDF